MIFLRWLGDWVYGTWISFFPPRLTLGCGHLGRGYPKGGLQYCRECECLRVVLPGQEQEEPSR